MLSSSAKGQQYSYPIPKSFLEKLSRQILSFMVWKYTQNIFRKLKPKHAHTHTHRTTQNNVTLKIAAYIVDNIKAELEEIFVLRYILDSSGSGCDQWQSTLDMLIYFRLHIKEKIPLAGWPLMSLGGLCPKELAQPVIRGWPYRSQVSSLTQYNSSYKAVGNPETFCTVTM